MRANSIVKHPIDELRKEFISRMIEQMPFGVSIEMIMKQVTRSFYVGHLKHGVPINDYLLSPGWADTSRVLTHKMAMGIFLDYFWNGE